MKAIRVVLFVIHVQNSMQPWSIDRCRSTKHACSFENLNMIQSAQHSQLTGDTCITSFAVSSTIGIKCTGEVGGVSKDRASQVLLRARVEETAKPVMHMSPVS